MYHHEKVIERLLDGETDRRSLSGVVQTNPKVLLKFIEQKKHEVEIFASVYN